MANVFGKARSIELERYNLEDILLKRYGSSIDYILNKDIDLAFSNVQVAIEKEQEEKLWDLYVAKSILADKNYPDWETVLKGTKEPKKETKIKETENAKEIIEKAIKMFKK